MINPYALHTLQDVTRNHFDSFRYTRFCGTSLSEDMALVNEICNLVERETSRADDWDWTAAYMNWLCSQHMTFGQICAMQDMYQ